MSGHLFDSPWADPAMHNSNTVVFRGRPVRFDSAGSLAADRAFEAVRRFVAERGALPTATSWMAPA
jgi:hypothetical protein